MEAIGFESKNTSLLEAHIKLFMDFLSKAHNLILYLLRFVLLQQYERMNCIRHNEKVVYIDEDRLSCEAVGASSLKR